MRTQIGSKIRFAALAVLATMLAQPALKAQAPGTAVVANIPFDFQIGSSHYAAGTYTIRLDGDYFLRLRSNTGSGVMLVRWDTSKPSMTNKLVFHHYGNRYFLRELRIKGSQEFVSSGQSSEEKRAEKEELASNDSLTPGTESTAEIALLNVPR